MDITLRQLQVFVAVARHENLSKASERLFMTKGAASQALGELERKLGAPLFDRVHPKLRLNHEGLRLLPLADELVHRAVDIERTFAGKSPEGREGEFLRLGCTKTIGDYVLPELLAGFSAGANWLPKVELANTGEVLRLLSGFALDVALVEGGERLPEIVFEPWLEDEMVVVAPPEHPLAGRRGLAARDLQGQKWIVRELDSGSREYFTHVLAPLVAPVAIALTLGSPEAIVRSVSQGLGLAFTSRLSAKQAAASGRLAVLDLSERFPRTFSLCYHHRKYHSAAMRDFLSFCRQLPAGDWPGTIGN